MNIYDAVRQVVKAERKLRTWRKDPYYSGECESEELRASVRALEDAAADLVFAQHQDFISKRLSPTAHSSSRAIQRFDWGEGIDVSENPPLK